MSIGDSARIIFWPSSCVYISSTSFRLNRVSFRLTKDTDCSWHVHYTGVPGLPGVRSCMTFRGMDSKEAGCAPSAFERSLHRQTNMEPENGPLQTVVLFKGSFDLRRFHVSLGVCTLCTTSSCLAAELVTLCFGVDISHQSTIVGT